MTHFLRLLSLGLWLFVAAGAIAQPVGTAFTYQGQLLDAGLPATGAYDLEFQLYDASSAGTSIAGPINLTGINVVAGLFTVNLDFGAIAFNGNARWLAVRTRQAGIGDYVALSPRQRLAPTPYAIRADTTAIADGAVSAPWVGLTGVPAGFADGVDNDTLAALLACQANDLPRFDGTLWSCAASPQTGVLSVQTGAGLTGGPILSGSSGTVSLAPQGVTSTFLAANAVSGGSVIDGSIKGVDVDLNEIQRRLVGECQIGEYVSNITALGEVECAAQVPAPAPRVAPPGTQLRFLLPDMYPCTVLEVVVPTDGLPVAICSGPGFVQSLLRKCLNRTCTLSRPTLQFGSMSAAFAARALPDGRVAIASRSASALGVPTGDVHVNTCSDIDCATVLPGMSIDGVEAFHVHQAMTVPPDGRPVVAFRSSAGIVVSRCDSFSCGSATQQVLGPGANAPAIATGANGFPILTYVEGTNWKLVTCINADCSSATSVELGTVQPDGINPVDSDASLEVTQAGRIFVAAQFGFPAPIILVQCEAAACTTLTTTIVEPMESITAPDIIVGPDELPLVSYIRATNETRVARCTDAGCTRFAYARLDEFNPNIVAPVATSPDGYPVLVQKFQDSSSRARVTKCVNEWCD